MVRTALRQLLNWLLRQEKTDGKIAARRNIYACGIADHERAGRDNHLRTSPEGEARGGDEVDRAAAFAYRHMGCTDGQRFGAELIRKHDAKLRSAN